MNKCNEQSFKGVRIEEDNCLLRFADDMAVVAKSGVDLKVIATNGQILKEYEMKINKKKTKFKVTGRDFIEVDIGIDGTKLKQVNAFSYLGSRIRAVSYTHLSPV